MKANPALLRRLAAVAALLLPAVTLPLFAQTTAVTDPVGFMTVTINGHDNTSGLDGNTALSFPTYNPADFQGAVYSLDSANQFTLTGAAWTAGAFAMPSDGGTATVPRLVRIKSGGQAGKFFRVTGNTTNQLTVDLSLYGLTNINTVLANGDIVELLPANTIGSIFGNPTTLAGGTSADTADNLYLQNGPGWFRYYWKTNASPSAHWVLNGGGNSDQSNTVIIYPDTGVYVLRRAVGNLPITFQGVVPTTPEKSDIQAPNTFLANRFPTDTTLGALSLQTLPGWVSNTSADTSSNVYILQPSGAWSRYYFKSNTTPTAHWVLNGGGNSDRGTTTSIPGGTAVYISFSSGTPATLSQALPYTLNP